MNDEIKSAKEIALARIEAQSGSITAQDRLRWRYVPEGEKLAGKVIVENTDITLELEKTEPAARPYLIQGAVAILLASIVLPSGEVEKEKTKRALDAIYQVKDDKAAADEIIKQIKNLFEHYESNGERQKQQAIEQLKNDYGRKLKQAIEQQLGSSAAGMVADVENLPQFKEEKRRLVNQFDSQYQKLLDDYKKELKEIG
ncbi:MAG: hypothetical protein JW954_00760 [Dehalococcoidaceae bacterium]|nr:hypothetical protein [Dehalococcoidaceae bacterium]